MTTGGQPFGAGHDSAGVTAPATSWFLAEGATGDFFDLFILIANPDRRRRRAVHATYLLPDGVDADEGLHGRGAEPLTIWVDDERSTASGCWPTRRVDDR